jgi:hypothetical protein
VEGGINRPGPPLEFECMRARQLDMRTEKLQTVLESVKKRLKIQALNNLGSEGLLLTTAYKAIIPDKPMLPSRKG